ncbi:MAG TPA: proton-conducting transporter membrane subunit [Chitinispirillaceae bacterium]|nr:proton-conducting transporter membrane subunit [Chitinispirillaceae bacterium]
MSNNYIYIAVIFSAMSGVPGLFFKRGSVLAQKIAVVAMGASAILGLITVFPFLFIDAPAKMVSFPWFVMGQCYIGVDSLSAFFLIPILLMGLLGSVYGLGYWTSDRNPANSRKLTLFWGLLVAGMILLVIGKHAMVFLLGWEIMALSAFFLVSTEDNIQECREAAWVYLIATHIGTLVLFALFSLWRWSTGSYMLEMVSGQTMSIALMNTFFFLALIGFGLKAGMMPLHFWLPAAHAVSPSHVSAMLSGVVLKMGIYGLVRWLSLFPHPPFSWGCILLVLGFISGITGVIFAIAQHDLKRLLAYHSVENIGIILMGLGIAMIGKSADRPVLMILGLSGCLLHVWNHSFFKSLLFLGAGSVIYHVHSRQIDQMGGLGKSMPWTSALFLVGAIAICGLPPLNGFISELFVYLGLFNIVTDHSSGLIAAVSMVVLAMIGALAAACFVKVYGAVFLGNRRHEANSIIHESSVSMVMPMVVLATLCMIIGLLPVLAGKTLSGAISVWSGSVGLISCTPCSVAPLQTISILAFVLCVTTILIYLLFRLNKNPSTVGTWDCGYAVPSNKMQYTASSFANSIVIMFQWLLHSREHKPHLTSNFPESVGFSSHVNELVLDRLLIPLSNLARNISGWFHRFQQGIVQHYILYILITLFLLLCSQIPVRKIIYNWFIH